MRLIDADELMEKVKKWLPPDPCGREEKEFPFETDICASMLMEIEEAPTAVDLVRCEDCKHHSFDAGYGNYWCNLTSGVRKVKPDDFCSRGERKES